LPGEPIVLSVQVNKPAYVSVLQVAANGTTTLVFPNARQTDALIPANTALRVPAAGVALKITADDPGTLLYEFVASNRGDSWLFKRKPQDGADFAQLGATTHALTKEIVNSLRVGHGPETAAAHLTVRVKAP
jgi:hypothetical protein